MSTINEVNPEAIATLYAAAQQQAIHCQENKNFTLYNFLLFNSFLLLGWATLYSSMQVWLDTVACTLICLIGILASLAWESLGRNYSDWSKKVMDEVTRSENSLPSQWPRFSTERCTIIRNRTRGTVGSRQLLIYTPRVLVGGYLLFIALSWLRIYWK